MGRKSTILFTLVLVFCVPASARTDRIENPEKVHRTSEYIQGEMAKRHIPGVSVAVVNDGKVIFAQGYGLANIEHSISAMTDTVYEIASVTKPFTATAIMMLVEEGKISLDDRITKYLPQLPDTYGGVTVRQLLSHTGGVMRDAAPGYWQSQPLKRSEHTRDEVISTLSKTPLDFQPGEKCVYSNTGYFLLGLIIEKASGEPYGEFLTRRIFNPLGMTSTRVADQTDVIKNRAYGYSWSGHAYRNAESISLKHHFANGGLVSTISDLVKWDSALYTGQLAKKSTLEQMWTPAKLNDGKQAVLRYDVASRKPFYVGLGWFLSEYRGHKTIGHLGDLPGFSAQVTRFVDDKITVIVLCNGDYGEDGFPNAESLAKGLADIYIPDLAELTLHEKAFNAYWQKDYKEAARLFVATIEDGDKSPNTFYNAASCFSLIGERDKAFSYLEKSIQLGFREAEWLKMDKDLEPLHSDPRWPRIVEMVSAKSKP